MGGRGLISLLNLYRKEENNLRNYIINHTSNILSTIASLDINYTALNLRSPGIPISEADDGTRSEIWKNKPLHGRFYHSLMDVGVDAEASLTWLKSGSIFPETEGFLFAIQEQVIATKAYRKHICGEGIDDLCRLCKKAVESIQHVTSGCTILAGKEYLQRHNNAAKVVHQAMAQKMELVDKYCPHYKYHPEPIISMRNVKVFWDQPILTDHTIPHNRPDILIIDKSKQSAFIIEIGVPSDDNLHKVVAEKKRKYVELAEEIKQLYHLKETRILPIVISCNGLIPEETVSSLRLLELPSQTIERMQQAVLLGTANIVRKFTNIK
ncbi:hypothetical protein COMNV_01291 [Commensalibacter sp. Nvir]|uniref:hypothetical protein n=1 Tax=Commensalibacter sp. Nvir TaxID=3069817 RepID=UPI002D45A640|nr:hypothetical protein COMNV_01291 [Commensalibacter sp. Nvir]